MKMLMAFALVMLPFTGGFAQTNPEVTGEVVEASSDSRELTIRVLESDRQRPEQAGGIETYKVPPGTDIELSNEAFRGTRGIRREVELGDLRKGDRVVVEIQETAEGRQAVAIRGDGGSEAADRQQAGQAEPPADRTERTDERTYDEAYASGAAGGQDRLPGSASPLPLLAFVGLLFAALGTVTRVLRARKP